MTRTEKQEVMEKTEYELNKAKLLMDEAVEILYDAKMFRDADQLLKMIYKLEDFQNKYN